MKAPATLPIHLPKNMVLLLEDLCAAAGVPGGATGFITHHFASLIKEEPASFCSGILKALFDDFSTSDDRITDEVHTAACRWRFDDKRGVVKSLHKVEGFKKAAAAATPQPRPLVINLPEKFRPIIESVIQASGFYGSASELMGHIVPPITILDQAADVAASYVEDGAEGFARVFGTLAIEKVRNSTDAFDQSTKQWLFGDTADKEAVAA